MKFNILIVSFLLYVSSISSLNAQPIVIDQVVAVVGNKAIKQSDIENEYLQARAQGAGSSTDLKCDIYESLIKNKMLLNQAIFDSLTVTESQVESELNRRLNYYIAQIGSVEKLENYFSKTLSEIKDDLRESLREGQLIDQMKSKIIGNVQITPSEVKSFYNKIPKDSIPLVPAQVEIAQIAAYPPYTEQAILDVKNRLLELRKRILDGEKFQVLANLYSEDPGSAIRGGELDYMTKAELDPEFAKAAFALNTPGEVSRIVESTFGYHIIQLVDKKGDRVKVRHILLKPKPDPEKVTFVKNKLDSIANLIRHDSITFDKAVILYSMDVDTRFNKGLLVNPNTGGTKFEMEQLAPADNYVVKKLKPGEVSDPYESRDKNGKTFYKIITIKSSTPAHKANLKDDYSMIQDYAMQQKKLSILDDWFKEKRRTTFIHLDDSFKKCDFTSKDWFKIQ